MDEFSIMMMRGASASEIRAYFDNRQREAVDAAVRCTEYDMRKKVCGAMGVRFGNS